MTVHRTSGDHLKHYCSTSAFPGIKYCQQADSPLGKIFWFLVTLAGFCIGTYVSTGVVRQFVTNPTYTTTGVELTDGLKFPPVTVCLLFRTTNAKLKELRIESVLEVEYLYHSFISFRSPIIINFEESERILSKINKSSRIVQMLEKYSPLEILRNLTPSCGELNTICVLGPASRSNNCTVSLPNIAPNGPCYTFRETENYVQRVSGTFGKAMIDIKLPTNSELPDTSFYAHKFDGVQFFSTIKDASQEKRPLLVGRGQTALIALEHTKKVLIRNEKNMCLSKAPCDDYVSEKCIVECMNELTYSACNCVEVNNFFHPAIKTYPYCAGPAYQACNLSTNETGQWTNDAAKTCQTKCPELCETEAFIATVSYAKLCDRERPDAANMISLIMYFPSLVTTVTEEKFYFQWQTLVSNIGGIYGLWVGAILSGVLHTLYSFVLWAWEALDCKVGQHLPFTSGTEKGVQGKLPV